MSRTCPLTSDVRAIDPAWAKLRCRRRRHLRSAHCSAFRACRGAVLHGPGDTCNDLRRSGKRRAPNNTVRYKHAALEDGPAGNNNEVTQHAVNAASRGFRRLKYERPKSVRCG